MKSRTILPNVSLLALLGLPCVAAFAQVNPVLPALPVLPATPPAAPQEIVPPPVAAADAKPFYHDVASGVDVYDVVTDDMFPAYWRVPPITASALPIAATERNRMLRLVKVALSKYPSAFLQANLKRVYLLGDLKFSGIGASGTNSTGCLYLRVVANNPLYTDRFLENTFHHEFGHLLQRNYRKQWSADAWAACNPTGFHYASKSGVEAVQGGKVGLNATDDWNRLGFLAEYGASNAAEDFATIAAKLLLGDPAFWKQVDTFPALKAKAEVAIAFYGKLNPRFTETYFRSLRRGVTHAEPPSATSPISSMSPVSPPITNATETGTNFL